MHCLAPTSNLIWDLDSKQCKEWHLQGACPSASGCIWVDLGDLWTISDGWHSEFRIRAAFFLPQFAFFFP